jgi:hypothetical protein
VNHLSSIKGRKLGVRIVRTAEDSCLVALQDLRNETNAVQEELTKGRFDAGACAQISRFHECV